MSQKQSGSQSASQKPKKKGEIAELQDSLNSQKLDQKREAVRKIIDAMTRGKDVSMLFPDMVKNMETGSMELKKLIYLYIINYSKTSPDLAILAINSFRKDAVDKVNPFLRALAVRTMGCMKVKLITEYLLDPLKSAIKDEDSYVRKTAAICIAKLYDDSPELMEEQGFLKMLENLVNDGNAMVVSNAICSQMQIQEAKGETLVNLTPYTVQKLLTAINESNEWGIIYILDALATYQPADAKDTEQILERVSPRLSHQNPGVVLAATRVMMKYLDFLTNAEVVRGYCRKLTAPMISLLQNENEIKYVALKNINLIIQKRPMVIDREIKVFFCDFNDAIYIKLQKLDILIRLANMDNIHQILHELKEYTSEVDVEFVRKSIRAIGRCAIKLEKAAEKCVYVLWECLKTKVQFVVYETIIVIRDIFRKYPRKYEAILKDLCDNLKLEDSEAKASMIWIIGEYSETIANADELLTNFAETFKEEQPVVQHSILISCIKLFLLRPQDGYNLIQEILKQATQECEDPDLRDRGFIYWRLMGTDLELTKKIVFSERPSISDQSYTFESEILDKLLEGIGNLSSVYYKPPQQFVKKLRDIMNARINEEDDLELGAEFLTVTQQPQADDYQGVTTADYDEQSSQSSSSQQQSEQQPQQQQVEDLLDMGDDDIISSASQSQVQMQSHSQVSTSSQYQQSSQIQSSQQPQQQQQQQQQQPAPQPDPNSKNIRVPFNEVLASTAFSANNVASGLRIQAAFQREGDNMYLYVTIQNLSQQTFSDFALKLTPNPFKLAEATQNIQLQVLHPNQVHHAKVQLNSNGQSDNQPPSTPFKVNCALKTNADVFVFVVPCSLSVLLVSGGTLNPQQYSEYSAKFAKKTESIQIPFPDIEKLKTKLFDNNFYLVGSRKNPQGVELFSFSSRCVNDMPLLFDAIFDYQGLVMNVQLQAPHPSMISLLHQAVVFIMKF